MQLNLKKKRFILGRLRTFEWEEGEKGMEKGESFNRNPC